MFGRGRSFAILALLGAALVVPAVALAVAGDFSQPSTSPEPAGAAPFSVAHGDFNGDGHTDLVTANFGFQDVTILMGDGTGDFSEPGTSPEVTGTSTGPSSVAIGSFNADANVDIAVSNFDTDNVTILLGDGTGNFTAVSPLESVGNQPLNVVVGSFNADANRDLAVTNAGIGAGSVTILLGDGTGNFTEPGTSPEPALGNARASIAADLNGDSIHDLAVAARDTDQVHILLGDGTGNFTAAAGSPEAAGDDPTSVEPINVDGDSDRDLAVTNAGDDKLTVLLNNGAGDFAAAGSSPESVGDGPRKVVAAPLGGDANIDLAVANEITDNVTILLGDGTGDFTEPASSPETAGNAPWWITAANLGGDAGIDLATANEFPGAGGNSVSILLNDFAAAPVNPPVTTPSVNTPANPAVSQPATATKCKKKKKKKKRAGAAAKCKKKKKKK